jgi:hypothetical protein
MLLMFVDLGSPRFQLHPQRRFGAVARFTIYLPRFELHGYQESIAVVSPGAEVLVPPSRWRSPGAGPPPAATRLTRL